MPKHADGTTISHTHSTDDPHPPWSNNTVSTEGVIRNMGGYYVLLPTTILLSFHPPP